MFIEKETSIEKIFMNAMPLVGSEGRKNWKIVMNSQIIYVSRCFSAGEEKKCKINRRKNGKFFFTMRVEGNIEKFDLQIIRKETDKEKKRTTEKLSIDLKALRKLT